MFRFVSVVQVFEAGSYRIVVLVVSGVSRLAALPSAQSGENGFPPPKTYSPVLLAPLPGTLSGLGMLARVDHVLVAML